MRIWIRNDIDHVLNSPKTGEADSYMVRWLTTGNNVSKVFFYCCDEVLKWTNKFLLKMKVWKIENLYTRIYFCHLSTSFGQLLNYLLLIQTIFKSLHNTHIRFRILMLFHTFFYTVINSSKIHKSFFGQCYTECGLQYTISV